MIAMLAAALTMAPAQSVADYFPLIPGTVWEYRESGGLMSLNIRDTVGAPEDIDGKPAWPIVTTYRGKELRRVYYRIEGDTVFIVGYDAKNPLSAATPIVKLQSGRATWEFQGDSMFIGEPISLTMKAESGLKGTRQVLGQEAEVLEVKHMGVLGDGSGTAFKVNLVAYYAKGIGLVESLSDNTAGKQKSKNQSKLVKFTPAKQG